MEKNFFAQAEQNIVPGDRKSAEENYYCSEEEQTWGTNQEGELLSVAVASYRHLFLDILLPTGLLIPIQCQLSRNLHQLKQDVFVQAKKLPLFSRLRDISNYIFSTIGMDGVHVELYDEQKMVSSLHLFLPILVLIEPEGNTIEKEMAQNISTAMGVSLVEMEKNATEESQLFRLRLFEACRDAAAERALRAQDNLQHYAFPEEPILLKAKSRGGLTSDTKEIHEEDLDYILNPDDPEASETYATEKLKSKIKFSDAYMEVWFREAKTENKRECLHSIKIKDILEKTPNDIVSLAIQQFRDQKKLKIKENSDEFILQIAGKTVFITRDVFVTQFEYIRSCFENYCIPKLILRHKAHVFLDYPEPPKIFEPAYVRKEKHNQYLKAEQEQTPPRSFWDLDENLRIRIHSASQISMLDISEKIFVRVAVAVGIHVLDVKDLAAVSPNNPRWQDGLLEFGVYLKDLPECAQLSFSLISIRKRKSKVQLVPVGWMNLRIFDWRHQLIQGKQSIYLWAFPPDFQDKSFINLSGTHGSNLNENLASRLELEFPEYDTAVKYPGKATIDKFIMILKERESRSEKGRKNDAPQFLLGNPDLDKILLLRRCLDPVKLSEDNQQFIWLMRHKIKELFPQMLVVLADCAVIWKERETICRFYSLLKDWPNLHIDTAIELLDGRYVDGVLRALAVDHLNRALNDDQLQLYLLVLIQAVRFEPYDDSPLTIMLIRRSLMNFRVGHTVFWLLRAELAHFPQDSKIPFPHMYTRFALMLEAYCRGNSVHLSSMIKQVEMISTLTALSVIIRNIGNKDAANKKLQQELQIRKESMQHICSPLNPTDCLGELLVEECKVLGSAKMPLRLAWRNPEVLAQISTPTHELIFKNGDDMRQDMLTLQVMRIMDSKWKHQNIDFCMTLYEVLPMGRNIGLIHVVQNCQTIFQIQCEAKKMGSSLNMDISLLNKYIYQTCSSEAKQYMECVDRFKFSLAGYCIATYVIGIKDRHQDNIMLARDGRIFHIDFGHFLGHTKRKLGINRERTDFILTDHFLYVISRGKNDYRSTHEYEKFRESCVKGFMIIYHHARFFIALFRLMLCMGLPELSERDIEYLRTSLMYDQIERKDVQEAFQHIFEDVIKSGWSTSINWFFHSFKHLCT